MKNSLRCGCVVVRCGPSQLIAIQGKRSGPRSGAFRCVVVTQKAWEMFNNFSALWCVAVPPPFYPPKGGIELPPSALRSGLMPGCTLEVSR